MSLERENEYSSSFDEIVSKAKEIILKAGRHDPVIIAEGRPDRCIFKVDALPVTASQRADFLYMIGLAMGEHDEVGELSHAFLIHEGWMSLVTKEDNENIIPSEDPNRIEVLVISAQQVQNTDTQLKIFEIRRNSEEQVIHLDGSRFNASNNITAETPLLQAFIEGYRSAYKEIPK